MRKPEQVLVEYAAFMLCADAEEGFDTNEAVDLMQDLADALTAATTPKDDASKMPVINFSDLVVGRASACKLTGASPEVEIIVDLADPKVIKTLEAHWNHTVVRIQLRDGDHRQMLWLSMTPVSGSYSPDHGIRVQMLGQAREGGQERKREFVMHPAKGHEIPEEG